MKKEVPIVLAIVLLFVPTGVPAEQDFQLDVPLHHFQLPCDNCHVPQLADPALHEEITNVGEIRGDISQLCTSSGCHSYDRLLNHPVGVSPKSTIPSDMPLDNLSRITCLTCHDKSKSSDNSGQTNLLLRVPTGMQFCGTCHTKMRGTLSEQSHWNFSARAHLGPINPQSVVSSDSDQFVGAIDVESHTCLSCHENVSVVIPAYNETPRQRKLRWKNMSDHPIGMDYEDTALRRVGGYKFSLADNPRIRLFNGKVGCGSCHSPYARTRMNLVDSYERSTLCRRCHNK
ncbi:MAG: cytochrome c3 family protein [Planctomycetota bacterium]|jgi:predicted CXXCH cytochrome family protein